MRNYHIGDGMSMIEEINAYTEKIAELTRRHWADGTLDTSDYVYEYNAHRDGLITELERYIDYEREDSEEHGYKNGHDDGYGEGQRDAERRLGALVDRLEITVPVAVDFIADGYLPATFDKRRVTDELRTVQDVAVDMLLST